MPGSMVGFNAAGEGKMNEIGGCSSCAMKGGKNTKKTTKKRKLSAYQLFMKKEMKRLKKLYPNKEQKDILKEAAKGWHNTKK